MPLFAFDAMEENLAGHAAFVQRSCAGMTVIDTPDLLLVDSGLPGDSFNKILRARLDEAGADRRIEEAIGWFRRAGHDFAWWVGPASSPADLEVRLEAHGLRPIETEAGMQIDVARLPSSADMPTGLEVRQVRDIQELTDFAAVMEDVSVSAYLMAAAPLVLRDDSPMLFFTGYLEGQPVATSELFIGMGIGGIYSVSTRQEFRRRGIGTALTWTAADAARRAGLPTVVLQASDAGLAPYTRLGFRVVCHFTEYAPAPRFPVSTPHRSSDTA